MARRKNLADALLRHSYMSEWRLAAGDLPPLAAHVVVSRTGYTHHGIHVGGGRVVHYSGLARSWRRGRVEVISLAGFAGGKTVRVRSCDYPRFDRDEVVARARSRLGENRYRLLANNCEHFCEWCIRGEHRSRQVEAWRAWPRRLLRAIVASVASGPRGPADDGGGAWAV
jgi:hypothetical protein